jgi:hypothetical protein
MLSLIRRRDPPSPSFRSLAAYANPEKLTVRKLVWSETMLAGMHRGFAVAVLTGGAFALTACGGGGSTYPANVRTSFLNSCETTGSKARCECSLKYVEAHVSFSAFQTAEKAIEAGDTNYPSWVIKSATSCAGLS